jgi:hypothetical protein
MNVNGKYDNGNDTWLGMSNVPGEWCIAYHGTKARFVEIITKAPLKAGSGQVHGHGIYCTPNIEETASYRDSIEVTTRNGAKKCQYVFMCRVNTRSIHHCTEKPCKLAKDPRYTLHMTTRKDYWFVNCQNEGYQNIRPYGILVREI